MTVVCMIPARMGSQRVKMKNLVLINGKPLIGYITEAAIKSNVFDDIYINSEAVVFEEIAKEYKIKFYKRSEYLASNQATNDDFALDFINNVQCDVLIQLLPTSPFITAEEIKAFVEKMLEKQYETMISVKNVQIECVYDGKPINFIQKAKTLPSQQLKPVQAYACGIMGWKADRFKENMEKYGAAYHGGEGTVGYFELAGYSTVDVDNEEDFLLAEAIADTLLRKPKKPDYYSSNSSEEKLIFDADRERILVHNGVENNTMNEYNKEVVSILEIIKRKGTNKSWSHTIINSPSNSATLIAQLPEEGNRMHFHPDWDEWWYIIDGEWEWLIEGISKTIKKGDMVFIERNRKHKITAKSNKMAIRLAVSRNDVDHVYEEENY